MVRGNWQKRVETADARRREAKQKKQRSEEKRVFKGMAQELLNLLDQNMDAMMRKRRKRSSSFDNNDNNSPTKAISSERWDIHIWTDTLLSSEGPPPFLENIQEQEEGKSRKSRSLSSDESHELDLPGGRSKKSGKGKKVHPRSHQADSPPANEDKFDDPLLCKTQFFCGKCLDPPPQKGGGGGSKKVGGGGGGCRYVHFNNKQMQTLANALGIGNKKSNNKPGNKDVEEVLSKAEKACEDHYGSELAESSPGSMEMLYFTTVPLPPEKDDAVDSFGDVITEKLAANNCGIGSIVYVVLSMPFKDVLIYDRNQSGMVITDFDKEALGSNTGTNGSAATSDAIHAQDLPVSVLEHILEYLEAPGVASAAQVCISWRREIDNASPNLWKHLLEQRNWPLPANESTVTEDRNDSTATPHAHDTSQFTSKCLRDKFIQHYSVLRDIRAAQSALTGLLTKNKSCEEREMTFQAFSTRRDAPQPPNHCVGVEVWGPNRVLAAYSNDCTLRLFQAVPRGGSSSHDNNSREEEKSCREIICQHIDPYKHTKRKSCYIEAMGLDEDVVGCLMNVSDEANDCKSPHIIVTLKRDDLLISDDEPEEGSLNVIDLEQAVLNYILSLDQVDHRLLRLNDFLALGGSEDEVEFIVSQSMAACGYGRFMVEVAISIPLPDDDDDRHADLDMLLLDRKLFLVSSNVGAIVWMGESNPSNEPLRPRLEDMTLSCLRRTMPGSVTRTSCSVVAVSQAYAPIVIGCEIDHSGHAEGGSPLGSQEWSQTERELEEGWNIRLEGRRPIVVTPTDVVVGDTLTRVLVDNNYEREYKSLITFYSCCSGTETEGNDSIFKLSIGEHCMIDRMVGARDDYIILLVRFFTENGYPADPNGGHWGNELDRAARVFAITIHVPTRREIERCFLYEDFGWNRLSLSVSNDTLACGVWIKGLIMSGNDVRSVKKSTASSKSVLILDDLAPKKAPKKSKKRMSKGSGKKDGFARGMSLRG